MLSPFVECVGCVEVLHIDVGFVVAFVVVVVVVVVVVEAIVVSFIGTLEVVV